ncbi:MAG TPA: HAMP domain-containing protein [Usitatibacteraceae bacterium]
MILFAVFAAGFLTVGAVAQRYLAHQALEDATRAALLILDAAVVGNMDARTTEALGSQLVEMKVREFSQDAGPSGVEGEAFARLKGGGNNQVSGMFAAVSGGQRLVVARRLTGVDGAMRIRIATIDLVPVFNLAKTALTTLMSLLAAVFFAVFFVLNLMLDRMIVRPVAEMARQADAVSVGDFSIAEFKLATGDEIGVLANAFNRMRRSTEEAIKLLRV